MTQADVRAEDIAALRRLRDQGVAAARRGRHRRRSRHAVVQPDAGRDRQVQKVQAVSAAHGVPPGDRLRGRSRRHRQHALPGRRRADLRAGHARQPHAGTPTPRRSIRTIPRARRRCSPGSGSRTGTATACSTTQAGKPVRFSIITQAGNIRARVATMVQEQLRQAGIAVDVVGLDPQVDLRPLRAGGLRKHLLRLPGERARPGDEPRLLAELGGSRTSGTRVRKRPRRRGRNRSTI